MKLIPAGGSPRMQRALLHPYAHTIVAILLAHPNLLVIVADLLQTYERRAQTGLEDDLEALRLNQQRSTVAEKPTTPNHVIELIQTLQKLYQLSNEDITYHRGAIVELLVYKLVSSRYSKGECVSNHRFVDEHGRYITDQIDVAALSRVTEQIEGYECKLKVTGIESSDSTNLTYLAQVAQEEDYHVNVGIVTFHDDRYMKRKLAKFSLDPCIKLYGLDSIDQLNKSPF